jgi:hypothetical protein
VYTALISAEVSVLIECLQVSHQATGRCQHMQLLSDHAADAVVQ